MELENATPIDESEWTKRPLMLNSGWEEDKTRSELDSIIHRGLVCCQSSDSSWVEPFYKSVPKSSDSERSDLSSSLKSSLAFKEAWVWMLFMENISQMRTFWDGFLHSYQQCFLGWVFCIPSMFPGRPSVPKNWALVLRAMPRLKRSEVRPSMPTMGLDSLTCMASAVFSPRVPWLGNCIRIADHDFFRVKRTINSIRLLWVAWK